MAQSVRTTLAFSEAFVRVEYAANVKHLGIDAKTTVLNLSDAEMTVGGTSLRPFSSSIYSCVTIPIAARVLLISVQADSSFCTSFPQASHIIANWTHVHTLIQRPSLKGTKLWRSRKDRVDDIEFNLWYAAAETDCGIHNRHTFQELHTQVHGVGRMQKFQQNDPGSIYQEVFMAPGYTHEPFYDTHCVYPWHQYYSDTDCLWLAVEFHAR